MTTKENTKGRVHLETAYFFVSLKFMGLYMTIY